LNFEDILIYGILAAVAFFVGYKYREIVFMAELVKNLELLSASLSNSMNSNFSDVGLKVLNIQNLKHEIVGDRHYFYDESDDTFICHGDSLSDAAKAYDKVFGDTLVGRFTSAVDGSRYVIVNGKIQTPTDLTS
jgi:hypothetical protein